MDLTLIIVGLALLTLGRKLFWVFVGGAGFAGGLWFASQYMTGQPTHVQIIVALVAGVAGIALAFLVKKAAVSVGGFLLGGAAAVGLVNVFALALPLPGIAIFIIGGLIGILLLNMLFDLGLLVVSSIAGALLIVKGSALQPPVDTIALVVLAILGLGVQWRFKRGTKGSKE